MFTGQRVNNQQAAHVTYTPCRALTWRVVFEIDRGNTYRTCSLTIECVLLTWWVVLEIDRSNYVSIICEAFEGPQLTEEFCASLAKTLKLSFTQHLAFALALAQSTQSSVQVQGLFFLPTNNPQAFFHAALGLCTCSRSVEAILCASPRSCVRMPQETYVMPKETYLCIPKETCLCAAPRSCVRGRIPKETYVHGKRDLMHHRSRI